MFEQFEYVNLLAGAGKFQVKGGLFARDINGNRLGLHVYHGNDKAALSGTVQGIAKFPPNSDNIEKFEFTGEIGQNGSDVWVDLPAQCYYYSGPMTVAIRLVDGDSRTVLATFSGHVNDITDGTPTVPPQSLPDNLEDFIAELEGMKTTVETAAAKVDSMEDDVNDLKSTINTNNSIYKYYRDIDQITNNGSGTYLLSTAFPSGNIDSITVKANTGTIRIYLYTLANGYLYKCFDSKSIEVAAAGMITIPIKRKAIESFYIVVSGNIKYRGGSISLGLTAKNVTANDKIEQPQSWDAIEFGINVNYALFGNFEYLGKRYLFVGDSYLQGWSPDGSYTSWGQRVAAWLDGFASVIAYKGGTGFIADGNGDSFQTLALGADVPNPNTITHVIVCGGANDANRNGTETQILTLIQAFSEAVKAKYPNATIYIGMIGYNTDATKYERLHTNVLRGYQRSVRYKLHYLNNVEYILNASVMSSDGLHPNDNGQWWLSEGIYNAVVTGTCFLRNLDNT